MLFLVLMFALINGSADVGHELKRRAARVAAPSARHHLATNSAFVPRSFLLRSIALDLDQASGRTAARCSVCHCAVFELACHSLNPDVISESIH